MSGGGLINLGDLTKPATVLIEKISAAVGEIFKPYQIRRIAQAEAAANRINAVSQIEINELHQRALVRFIGEEARKQANIESITAKALPLLDETSRPQEMENDWLTNFFDKCRLISNDEMQVLWSKILAGEANSPGRFSKRTLNMLSSLDKSDAEMFRALCSFAGNFRGEAVPFIYRSTDPIDPIYARGGVEFNSLKHLSEIGLITFDASDSFTAFSLPREISIFFPDARLDLIFPNPDHNELEVGNVLLSKSGQDLASICQAIAAPTFITYLRELWQQRGIGVIDPSSSPTS